MVHGTAKALVASGPHACQSGFGRRFFLEAKIFEVSRAIVFNQPTFLVSNEWMVLSSSMRVNMPNAFCRLMDELLDIIALCAALRVR